MCGMHVEPSSAAAAWPFGGVTYFFCSLGCLERFKADPEGVLAMAPEDRAMDPSDEE